MTYDYKSAMKYRNKNKEKYLTEQRQYNLSYYSLNKETLLQKKRAREAFQREWKRVSRILL
jgi:hypothetical protein